MWLFTKYGFFSAVLKLDGSGLLKVRARARGDLVNLLAFFPAQDQPEILISPDRDYPYRVITDQTTWADVVHALAMDLDYNNFKGARGNPVLSKCLHDVWGVMLDHEDREAKDARRLHFDEEMGHKS